ncbi:helix-turn-helix domain-containing protein [Bacillus sp. ISL-53]|nr:helix-turn-helix domain-containing protein [Bacillus sp. ISL-53]
MKIERLVRKAQKGDKNAFETLFQNYKEEIYRTAFIYIRTQEDSLDIVQEVAYKEEMHKIQHIFILFKGFECTLFRRK